MGRFAQVDDDHIIVLFDGVCNLCNGSVQFVIKRDPKGIFKFASLQSQYASALLTQIGLDASKLYSIIVVTNNKVYQRSDAALKVASRLPGMWPMMGVFKVVPRFIRDAVYNFIASRRYKYFGKRDSCMLPEPGVKDRFLDQ
jgi:predicted DCC family thiol-disulfide oxidoreductase YuxK